MGCTTPARVHHIIHTAASVEAYELNREAHTGFKNCQRTVGVSVGVIMAGGGAGQSISSSPSSKTGIESVVWHAH